VAGLHRYAARELKTLLVVMGASALRDQLVAALAPDFEAIVATDAAAARVAMLEADGLVIDASLELLGPEDVVEAADRRGICQLPVIVCKRGEAGAGEVWARRGGAFALREAGDLGTLLAQVNFLLHRNAGTMSDDEQQALEAALGSDRVLVGKKALIVDDDMRNIFALATVLDNEGMVIVSADNGREAIRLVESDPAIDIVLMDIMMPEMDGIATMQEIRKLPRGRELPIVAVTAKAMKGDRQKCIEAGAWDYLSKPVDPPHMLAVLRGWLCR
jgi:CheY-like chemotaxis protein